VATLHALVDYREPAGVIEWYGQRPDAEAAMLEVLDDEPSWAGYIDVLEVELDTSPN